MNKSLAAAVSLLVLCGSSGARADIVTDENGRKMDCHDEQVTTTTDKQGHPILGAIAGAAAGGVIGHQFGGGRGKDLATAGGAVAGGVGGHELAKGGTKQNTTTERHCRVIE